MAFFGGTVGAIYRQFSVTIVSAMILYGVGRDDPDTRPVCHAA
ncbi:hypothetical protein WDV93_00685 [Pantoea ananatis]